jgi:hypothetical protein
MSRERTKGAGGPASAHDSVRSTLDTDGMLAEWGARLFYPIPKGTSCRWWPSLRL